MFDVNLGFGFWGFLQAKLAFQKRQHNDNKALKLNNLYYENVFLCNANSVINYFYVVYEKNITYLKDAA